MKDYKIIPDLQNWSPTFKWSLVSYSDTSFLGEGGVLPLGKKYNHWILSPADDADRRLDND